MEKLLILGLNAQGEMEWNCKNCGRSRVGRATCTMPPARPIKGQEGDAHDAACKKRAEAEAQQKEEASKSARRKAAKNGEFWY
uniref:Uncharacterized protein n=1 Tax=Oryza barthii TaxID=65489 RepID=A0A0D3H6B1_9ORYZ